MRFLAILNAFEPDRGGGSAVYSDMCFELAERGVDVTVLAPYPFYPEWRDKSGRNGIKIWDYNIGRVRVRRFGMYIPSNPRSLCERALFEFSLTLSLMRSLPEARCHDVVMTYCPQVSNVVIAALMRALYGKPVWLNVQDVATDAAAGTGKSTTRALMKILVKFERFLYNRTDVWSTISPVMQDKIAPLRQREQPLLLVPNWADKAFIGAVIQHPRRRNQPRNPLRLLYAGNVGAKQDLLRFCRILSKLQTEFRFRIFGSGGAFTDLRKWVQNENDSRFEISDFLGPDELARELSEADFYVITEKPGIEASFFPSKMITGMTAGTPIMAISESASPLGQEMNQYSPGVRYDWEEAGHVSQLLAELNEDSTRWVRWHKNALRRARHYDRNGIIERIHGVLLCMARGESNQIDAKESPGTTSQ